MIRFGFLRLILAGVTAAATLGWAEPAYAQAPPCAKPVNLPPANSPVLFNCMHIIAHPVNETSVPQDTYTYYVKTKQTLPSQNQWSPFDEEALKADFWSL